MLFRSAACMKHYMGYGVPVSGKDRTPSSITEQDMREKHFAPYLEMVKAGALSVMVNSAMNNGLPFHANYELLTKWLKEDLNWDGMIVTDWADINNLYSRDHIAKDKKEAIKLAINAGIDMSMDPYDWKFCTLLKELVEEGEVPMSRIDDAVRRVLRLKYRLNLFEKPYYDLKDFPLFGSAEHAAAALQAAEESLVLLKNTDGILPLAKGKKLLVTGPNANSMRCLNGGWSYSWQGDKADEHIAHHKHVCRLYKDLLSGIQGVELHENPSPRYDSNYWLCTILLDPSLHVKGEEHAYETAVEGAVGGAAGVTHAAGALHTASEPNPNVEAMRMALDAAGIESRPLWKPMHLQPVYARNPAYVNGASESLFKRGLCLPSGPYVSDEDVQYIVDQIRKARE